MKDRVSDSMMDQVEKAVYPSRMARSALARLRDVLDQFLRDTYRRGYKAGFQQAKTKGVGSE